MKGQRRAYTNSQKEYGQVQGNTVRKLQAAPERHPGRIEAVPARQISNATRKNRDKARNMNMGYVLFLTGALILSGTILTIYLGLQSDITNSITSIARLEKQLNNLKSENDEESSRINNSIDLEEIRQVAIQELGMGYAEEGQIIDFTGSRNDYVRQVMDLPE